LSISLNDWGHEAYHLAHIGGAGAEDWQIVELALARDMILVTNNTSDFRSLYAAQELHPGLVILVPNVERETPIAVVPCGARSAARDRGIGE